jgi:hypothetical protein
LGLGVYDFLSSFSFVTYTGVTRDTYELSSSSWMVIKSNKGFCIIFLIGVLAISGWVEIPPGDLIFGGGNLGFSGPVIYSSCIGSKPLGSPLLSIGSSAGILDISTISG